MDRTLIAPYKAEEKDLSEKLYNKLEGLMLIYPPSEELKKYFAKDMFIKSNPMGFFHVFHYLLRIHDAAEFKKRFYWPITDKRGESSFRAATVEYLKFISEKHNLNWNVKSYLVQMPGGMKFIIFVLDFIGFIIDEQIRLREKQLGIEVSAEFSEQNLRRIQQKHKFLIDYTADYLSEVEQQTSNLRRQTQLIKAELYNFEYFIQTDIDSKFLKTFESSNAIIFESNFMKHTQEIITFEKLFVDLKNNIDKYQQKAFESRKDKGTLCQTLKKINESHDAVKPTMDNLTMAFVQIQPIMENWLAKVVEKNSAISSEMTSELLRLQIELSQIEAEITDHYQRFKISANFKARKTNVTESVASHILISKFISTPPTKVHPNENSTSHLPLLGEPNSINHLDITRSAHKAKPSNTSVDLSTTFNRSQIVDPVQMLRTIYKDKTKMKNSAIIPSNGNSSLLGVKWKKRQLFFGTDSAENITPIKLDRINTESSDIAKEFHFDIKISSPKTPFNACLDEVTSIGPNSYMHSPTVKQVDVLKEDAFNIKNISTSPTGRLEPLCFAGDSLSTQNEAIDNITSNTENNQNFLNVQKKVELDLNSILNDDSIFNTSDTVLTDVV